MKIENANLSASNERILVGEFVYFISEAEIMGLEALGDQLF